MSSGFTESGLNAEVVVASRSGWPAGTRLFGDSKINIDQRETGVDQR
jgi:hypothetical protein